MRARRNEEEERRGRREWGVDERSFNCLIMYAFLSLSCRSPACRQLHLIFHVLLSNFPLLLRCLLRVLRYFHKIKLEQDTV